MTANARAIAGIMFRPREGSPSRGEDGEEVDTLILELTTAMARGDTSALETFYRVWFDRAFLLARSFTRRDESFCLDIVQDSMVKIIRLLKPMDTRQELEGWVTRVVQTTAIDLLRREARRARNERQAMRVRDQERHRESGNPVSLAEMAEEIRWLEERLAETSDRERSLLRERFERGKTLREAGEALGMSSNAAHGCIRRVVLRLRRRARKVFHHDP